MRQANQSRSSATGMREDGRIGSPWENARQGRSLSFPLVRGFQRLSLTPIASAVCKLGFVTACHSTSRPRTAGSFGCHDPHTFLGSFASSCFHCPLTTCEPHQKKYLVATWSVDDAAEGRIFIARPPTDTSSTSFLSLHLFPWTRFHFVLDSRPSFTAIHTPFLSRSPALNTKLRYNHDHISKLILPGSAESICSQNNSLQRC